MPTKKQVGEETERQKEMVKFFKSIPKKGWRIEYFGKYFYIFPDVFIPTWDTIPLFKNWKIQKNARVLDAGTGIGIIAIMSKYKGAGKVIAFDINSAAVKAARFNTNLHRFKRSVKIIKSDLFDNLNKREKFDIIVANLPWRDISQKNIVEKSMWDKDLAVNKRFFKKVSNFLKPKGRIYFLQSNFGEVREIKKLIKQHGFIIKNTFKERDGWRIFYVFELIKK